MTPNRIRELLKPFLDRELSDEQIESVLAYLELLQKWNSKINLTTVRDAEEIVSRHFGESFFAAQHLLRDPTLQLAVIDVGSGAGFPGIALKIWAPAISLTLIEANQRKAVFLREVLRTLKVSGANVLAQRAESVGLCADLVTLRAVERFEQVLPIAGRLLKPDGTIALLVGSSQIRTAESALPRFQWQSAKPTPQSRSRVLLVGRWDL